MDWFKAFKEKMYSGETKTIQANSDVSFELQQSRIIKAILFEFSGVAPTDYENIQIQIMAGSVDKTFFNGTINDLLMVGYLQNTRNLTTSDGVKVLLNFDMDNDNIATPLIPYIEPITIKITNKTANNVSVQLGYVGVDTEKVITYIAEAYRKKNVDITEFKAKEIMKSLFKKRVFLSTYHEFGSSTLTTTIPSKVAGIYEAIVVYQIEGNLKTLKLSGLDIYVDENDVELLTDYALLKYQLPPEYKPVDKFAIISNMPATMQYQLYATADPSTKIRVLTSRIF